MERQQHSSSSCLLFGVGDKSAATILSSPHPVAGMRSEVRRHREVSTGENVFTDCCGSEWDILGYYLRLCKDAFTDFIVTVTRLQSRNRDPPWKKYPYGRGGDDAVARWPAPETGHVSGCRRQYGHEMSVRFLSDVGRGGERGGGGGPFCWNAVNLCVTLIQNRERVLVRLSPFGALGAALW